MRRVLLLGLLLALGGFVPSSAEAAEPTPAEPASKTEALEKRVTAEIEKLDKRLGALEKKAAESTAQPAPARRPSVAPATRAAAIDAPAQTGTLEAKLVDLLAKMTSANASLEAIVKNTGADWSGTWWILVAALGILAAAAVGLALHLSHVKTVARKLDDLVHAMTAPRSLPSIADIDPRRGAVTGFDITISGSNFQAGAAVRVRGNFATNVEVRSAAEIRARAPAGTPGEAEVVVQNPDGARNATPVFLTYVPAEPVVRGIHPADGPAGTTLVVYGANFQPGAIVRLGHADIAATRNSENDLSILVPLGPPGDLAVAVRNPGGADRPSGKVFSRS